MLRLRPFKDEDTKTILSWCHDEKAFYKWTAGVLGDYPLSEKAFGQVKNNMAFTAVDDDDVIGFFTMRRPGASHDVLRFGFVTVDSEKRGQGYGKAMLKLGLKYAKEIYGAKKVTLGVFENNPAAYYCYKAAGFNDVILDSTETYHVLGEDWNCLEMEAEL